MTFAPFLELLHIGQINVITAFGLCVMYLAPTSFPLLAGMGLSLAIVTKVTPFILLGYLVALRNWRVVITSIAVLLVLCGLAALRYGAHHFITYVNVFQGLLHEFPLATYSHSLVSKLAVAHGAKYQMLLAHLPTFVQPVLADFIVFTSNNVPQVQRGLTIYMAAVLLTSGSLTLMSRQREPLFIVTNLVMMFAPNIMWYHHYVYMLLPLLIWMAWSRLHPAVVAWTFLGLLVTQIERWHGTYGLLVHLFGHISIGALLIWQFRQVYRQVASHCKQPQSLRA